MRFNLGLDGRAPVLIPLLMAASMMAELVAVEGDVPVVTVNGEAITLRQLEDELLRKEGVARLSELITAQLEGLDWSTFEDGDLIIQIGDRSLTRLQVAAELLKDDGPRVRHELINIALVRHALADAGIEINQDVIETEFKRQEQEFAAKLRERGDTVVPFAEFLRVSEKMTVEEYTQQEGFRIGAGLHELVHQRAEIPEAELQDHFTVHREQRFVVQEAVDLQILYIPFRLFLNDRDEPVVNAAGEPVLDPKHQKDLPKTMHDLYEEIRAGKRDFNRTWMLFGRPYDPQATLGKVGWIDRTGRRAQLGARRIPAAVVERAFEADISDGPALLPPIVHDDGVDLVRVLGHRPGERPEFAEIRDQVRHDYIESNLSALRQELMKDIGSEIEVDYGDAEMSLGRMTAERLREAGVAIQVGE